MRYRRGLRTYEVDSATPDGAVVNVFGVSIVDMAKLSGLTGLPGGYAVEIDGERFVFPTFRRAYGYAEEACGRKKTRK